MLKQLSITTKIFTFVTCTFSLTKSKKWLLSKMSNKFAKICDWVYVILFWNDELRNYHSMKNDWLKCRKTIKTFLTSINELLYYILVSRNFRILLWTFWYEKNTLFAMQLIDVNLANMLKNYFVLSKTSIYLN